VTGEVTWIDGSAEIEGFTRTYVRMGFTDFCDVDSNLIKHIDDGSNAVFQNDL
jgi:hypothetical protein